MAIAFLALRLRPVIGGGEAEIPPDWLEFVALLGVILAPAALAVLSLRSHASLLGGAVVGSMGFGVGAVMSIGLPSLVVGLLYLVAFLWRTDRGAETVWRRGLVFVLVLGASQGALFGLRMSDEPACWTFGTAADGSRTVSAIPLTKTVAPDGAVTYTGAGVTIRRTGIKTFVKALNDVVLYLQPALSTPAMSTDERRVPLNRGERRQARRSGR